jgi:hypothetical protein
MLARTSFGEQIPNAVTHLAGGLVGKGDGKHGPRWNP